ncbi:MAG: phosphoribosylanthranilate isomerase [Chloroflexi bacterium]|nr:MAG: phosphoribosylanthranilate isomerase [Chloroflexota bacterium]
MKVKICGIRSYEDAMMAIDAGADLLGFNFYPKSPRYITPGDCMRLVVRLETALRDGIAKVMLVGVFVNAEVGNIHAIFRDCHLDMIQLSGDEPPEMLEELGERAFKALRPTSAEALEEAVRQYPERHLNPAWLIDSYRPGVYGGTGETGDWALANQLARKSTILLAGGLQAGNVGEAIQQVNPWGGDVASGVESAPGVKDAHKVQEFIRTVRLFAEEFSE